MRGGEKEGDGSMCHQRKLFTILVYTDAFTQPKEKPISLPPTCPAFSPSMLYTHTARYPAVYIRNRAQTKAIQTRPTQQQGDLDELCCEGIQL